MKERIRFVAGEIERLKTERDEIVEQRERLEAEIRAGLSGEVVKASQAKANSLQEQFHSYSGRLAEIHSQLVRNSEEQTRTQERMQEIQERLELELTQSSTVRDDLANLDKTMAAADDQRAKILCNETESRDALRQAEAR